MSSVSPLNVATSTVPTFRHWEPDPYADIHLGDSQPFVGLDAEMSMWNQIWEVNKYWNCWRQGIKCLKSSRHPTGMEQGYRAQMSGTRKLKTGSHLAGSKQNESFLKHQLGQMTMELIWINHEKAYCISIDLVLQFLDLVPWSRLWKIAVALHWLRGCEKNSMGLEMYAAHAASIHQNFQSFCCRNEPFDIHHTVLYVVIHETSSSSNQSLYAKNSKSWSIVRFVSKTRRRCEKSVALKVPSLMPIHLSKSSLFLKPPWDPVVFAMDSWMRGVSRV